LSKEKDDFTCREANNHDLPLIAEFCRRHDFGPTTVEWLKWKYLDNPNGRALIYIVVDRNENIVGLQAFLPRWIKNRQSTPFLMFQPVDVFVSPEVRGKGVFSKLVEFCRTNIEQPRFSFPNEASLRIGLKDVYGTGKRHAIVGKMDTWIFPIIGSKMISDKAPKFMFSFADILSRFYALIWLGRYPQNVSLQPMVRFLLDYELDLDSFHGIRSAAYLNWRFIDNPMNSFACLEFLEDKESIGYCVFAAQEPYAKIYDFFTFRKPRSCLRVLVNHLRGKGHSHIIYGGVGLHLRSLGFLRRGFQGYMTTLGAPHGPWFATLADKD
jgi:GNAT superfamily N-acetyltransferase